MPDPAEKLPHSRPSVPDLIEILRQQGCRITRKRRRILQAMERLDHPASADEIRVLAELPASDLVTVYRNLETFETAGILQRIPLENGSHLFELTAPGEHYHHFICRECHYSERLNFCIGDSLAREARSRGFSNVSHVLEVYGYCEQCGVTEAKHGSQEAMDKY